MAGTGAAGTGTAGMSLAGAAGFAVTGFAGAAGAPPLSLPSGALAISGVDAVGRIANVLWGTGADADVLAQAQHFQTTNDLVAPILAMLADPRAAIGVGKFYRWWLNLDAVATTAKDPQLFPTYTPALQADMAKAAETFAVTVTLKNGTYETLLTSPSSFANSRLQDIYGVMGFMGDALQPISLPPTERAGLLTQPSLQVLGSVSTRDSPAHRGSYILQRFLCQTIPQSPPSVPPLVPPPPGTSLRTAITQYEMGLCTSCHEIIDGPGFAFETFDAIGHWRTTDNGAPVDVSNLNLYIDGVQKSFSGPIELARLIVSSTQGPECLAQQWLAFATGGTFDKVTAAIAAPAFAAFKASGFNLRALIVAVLTSGVFLAPP